MTAESRTKPPPQSAARLAAIQALYQLAMTGEPVDIVAEEFLRYRIRGGVTLDEGEGEGIKPKEEFFSELFRGTCRRKQEIDEAISSVLSENWTLDRLELVLRCVLEVGTYEMLARKSVPAKIVINEYVDLAHAFYAGAEPGMVNGILDRLAKRIRAAEFGRDPA